MNPPHSPTARRRRFRTGAGALVVVLALAAGLITGCDRSAVLLEGTVTYGAAAVAGNPNQPFAADVPVTLYADDTETVVATTTTNLVGHFAFDASTVAEGTYRVQVGAEFSGGTSWATATSVTLSAASTVTVNHTLSGAGTITGTTVDAEAAGVPAAVLLIDGNGNPVATTFAAADGTFTLGVPSEGTWTVRVKGAGAPVDVGGAEPTPVVIGDGTSEVDLGAVDVTTGLAPAAPWTATVTVTGASAADGLALAVTGSGFVGLPSASTGAPAAGVYVALRDPATMPNEAINLDTSIVPAVTYLPGMLISDGAFSANLSAPAAALDPDAQYEVITWVAHGNLTDATLLTTTPVTLTDDQRAALFG